MATLVNVTDIYDIGIDDYTPLPYQKNGIIKVGGYDSRQQYCWEILMRLDVTGLPPDAVITSITTDINITNYNSNNSPDNLSIRVQDKGAWTDNDTDEPTRVKPAFFDETGSGQFPSILTEEPVPVDFVGILTLNSTQAFVDWANDVVNGVQPANGLMLTHYPNYYAYYIEADTIQFTIEYDAGSTRRRVMIIS